MEYNCKFCSNKTTSKKQLERCPICNRKFEPGKLELIKESWKHDSMLGRFYSWLTHRKKRRNKTK